MSDWRTIVAEIAADNRSGATAIAIRAAEAIAALVQDKDFRREALNTFIPALVAAQPSMAPLFHLANEVLWAVEGAGPVDWRYAARQAAQARAEALRASPQAIARHAVATTSPGSVVLTHSASAAVAAALRLGSAQGRVARAICTESRPQNEGRALARDLAAGGLPVTFVVDAAAYEALAQADAVWIGADALAAAGVVNKIGSAGLAVLAGQRGIPVRVLAGRDKVWPAALSPAPPMVDHDPAEVWAEAPPGVSVVNRYFDLTPWWAVTAVVMEDSILKPEAVQALAEGVKVHPALRP
jgi:translation initiation factor 2B subunit (eIF-2B alpha/beta/delta family)